MRNASILSGLFFHGESINEQKAEYDLFWTIINTKRKISGLLKDHLLPDKLHPSIQLWEKLQLSDI